MRSRPPVARALRRPCMHAWRALPDARPHASTLAGAGLQHRQAHPDAHRASGEHITRESLLRLVQCMPGRPACTPAGSPGAQARPPGAPQFKHDISALASKGDLTFAAVRGAIIECKRVHRSGEYRGHSGDVIQLLPLGDHLLSLGRDGKLLLWRIGEYAAPEVSIQLPEGLAPTCMAHPDTYLNKASPAAAPAPPVPACASACAALCRAGPPARAFCSAAPADRHAAPPPHPQRRCWLAPSRASCSSGTFPPAACSTRLPGSDRRCAAWRPRQRSTSSGLAWPTGAPPFACTCCFWGGVGWGGVGGGLPAARAAAAGRRGVGWAALWCVCAYAYVHRASSRSYRAPLLIPLPGALHLPAEFQMGRTASTWQFR
jgi:hypothetical protein